MTTIEEIEVEVRKDVEEINEGESSADCSASGANDSGFIEHKVTKFDTLAGLAIKYGLTVLEIKQANGLLSDSAMFARDTLLIPQRKRGAESSTDASAIAQFVGGLGRRDFQFVPVSSPSRNGSPPGVDPIRREDGPSTPQEIELGECVAYAGSKNGVDQSVLSDLLRRRRKDDSPTSDKSNTTPDSRAPLRNGKPPTPPSRAPSPMREFLSMAESLVGGSQTSQANGEQTFFSFFKPSSPGGESIFEKIKRVANAPALASPGMTSVKEYGSPSDVKQQLLSRGAGSNGSLSSMVSKGSAKID